MDTNKIVVGVLILLFVVFFVVAGPSCGEPSIDDEVEGIGCWTERFDALSKMNPDWFAPAPLCAQALATAEPHCSLRSSLRLARGVSCRYEVSGPWEDQREAELRFVGNNPTADGLQLSTSDSSLLKVVPSEPRAGESNVEVHLYAMKSDEGAAPVSLTIKCVAPRNGTQCRLTYFVEKLGECTRRSP